MGLLGEGDTGTLCTNFATSSESITILKYKLEEEAHSVAK